MRAAESFSQVESVFLAELEKWGGFFENFVYLCSRIEFNQILKNYDNSK